MFSSQVSSPSSDKKFSLDKYLSYIGLDGFNSAKPSLEVLTTIIKRHVEKFIYRNTTIFEAGKHPNQERKIPHLDINNLYETMLENNGGYCFQHLELMYAALTAMGFTVDRHLAKIVLQLYSKLDREDAANPKTHELVVVHINDKRYIVDVGMGNLCLREPLELKEGEQNIGGDQYRLTNDNDRWILDTKTSQASEWFCLYRFYNSPVPQDEIVKAHQNMYLTEHKIPIRDDMLLIGKTTAEKRKHLVWHTKGDGFGIFKSVKQSGEEKTREFTTLEDAKTFAKKKFGFV